MAPRTIHNENEVLWNADGCRYLQGRAGVRNISNRAFDLRGFVTNDYKGSFQHAPAQCDPLFVHR